MSNANTTQDPEDWHNDERMRGLFSQLPPSRAHNSAAWDDKVTFWRQMLLDSARRGSLSTSTSGANSRLTVDISVTDTTTHSTNSGVQCNLEWKFVRAGLRPRCIAGVLEEMLRTGDLIGLDTFNNDTLGRQSLISSIFKNARWAVNWLMENAALSQQKVLTSGTFVLVPLIQQLSNAVSEHIQTSTKESHLLWSNELMTVDDFVAQHIIPAWRQTFNDDVVPNLEELQLLLGYLQSHHKISLDPAPMKDSSQKYKRIKIIQAGSQHQWTDEERNYLSLTETIKSLTKHIDTLHIRVDTLEKSARQMLSLKRKSAALSILRTKKSVQHMLDRRLQSLSTLETIVFKIQQAKTDVEIVNAFQRGTETVKSVNSKMSVETVDQVMDDLKDAIDDSYEIDQTIKQGQDQITGMVVDDADVEAELDALLAEESKIAALDAEMAEMERLKSVEAQLDALPTTANSPQLLSDDEQKMKPVLMNE